MFVTTELGQSMIKFEGASHLLAPGGILHTAGNAGPMGPLGIAGLLGPNGAHGYARNSSGDYIDRSGVVQKSVTLAKKKFDLYELYRLEKLNLSNVLDTSFAIRGEIDRDDQIEVKVKSKTTQWIHVLAVNENPFDTFGLHVEDEHRALGNPLDYL